MAGLSEIAFDDLEFYERCGGGSFGCVYRALWRSHELQVAAKKVLILDKEAEVLSRLSHRNIVCFYGAVTKEPNFCLVMEYAENGSLFGYLENLKDDMLPFERLLKWAKEVALGMNYLHNEAPVKVIHRDLKSKNVVICSCDISKDLVCKICDFGSSRFMGCTTMMSLAGTYPWMAPEVIQSFPVSEFCDVWSYGVVLWELLTHEVPFKGIEGFQVAWMVVENGKRLTIPSSCPVMFKDLMQSCWNLEPKERATFQEILVNIQHMQNDDHLPEITSSYLRNRLLWTKEIESSLEELKKMDRSLGLREEELHTRERKLREREKRLEEQFQVVQLDTYDVSSWREIDVHQWIQYQLGTRLNKRDLGQYADLFLQNSINGNRLLMLSQQDMQKMGISSHGHIVDLHNEIQILKSHNYRLQNFPPLTPTLKPKVQSHAQEIRTIKLCSICILSRASSLQDTKWKMLLDVVDDDDEESSEIIKHVTFTTALRSNNVYKISKSPFLMDKWVSGISSPNMTVECNVTFEDKVIKPRSIKFEHVIDVINANIATERFVSLTIEEEVPDSVIPSLLSPSHRLAHSKSSPLLLKGAWSRSRTLEHSVPPLDIREAKQRQVSDWSDVVMNKKHAQFPASNPKFSPVPKMYRSTTSSDMSSPAPLSRSSLESYSSYSSSIHSAEPSPQVDWNQNNPSMTMKQPLCSRLTDLSMFHEEELRDVVLNDLVRFSIGEEDSAKIGACQTPQVVQQNVPTIANIVREYIGKEAYDSTRRKSSPGVVSRDPKDDLDDLQARHVRTGSMRENESHSIKDVLSSSSEAALLNGIRPQVIYRNHRENSEDSLPPGGWRKGKRKKFLSSRVTRMDSLNVHGGNPKWMWKS